jgi:hypothetical protein
LKAPNRAEAPHRGLEISKYAPTSLATLSTKALQTNPASSTRPKANSTLLRTDGLKYQEKASFAGSAAGAGSTAGRRIKLRN